jgi:hypothetical protein
MTYNLRGRTSVWQTLKEDDERWARGYEASYGATFDIAVGILASHPGNGPQRQAV